MRRESIILTACFALLLATFSPIRATATTQEDANAGIMTLSAGDLAFSRISDLIRAENDGYTLTSESSASNTAELYTYILKDVADDSTGDVWFFSGALLAYGRKTSSSSSSSWLQFSLSAELYRLPNGNWALKDAYRPFGLPSNMTSFSNTYGVTYEEGATFFEQYVACERRYCELRGTTFNEATYANYINYAAWDTDNGGVNNLAEWVRGTRIDYWKDDAPSDSKCKCGACCSCECKCGLWSGAECDQTPDACDCHKEEEPDEECACADYCCRHTCECPKCADGEHSAHKNDNGECDGTFENCSDCHKEENPDEECTCANYCCYHTCACKRCASLPAASHSQHKNGSPTCNGTTSSGGCVCHETTDDEDDEPVTLPTDQDFNSPTEEKKDAFISDSKLKNEFDKLKSKLSQKFGIERLVNFFTGDLSGELPIWTLSLPDELGGAVELDFNVLLDYSIVGVTRAVLSFVVYFFTAATVFNSLRRLL